MITPSISESLHLKNCPTCGEKNGVAISISLYWDGVKIIIKPCTNCKRQFYLSEDYKLIDITNWKGFNSTSKI